MPADLLVHVLLAVVVVLVTVRLVGSALRWLGQPPVMGEVLGGLLLGPSVLGQVAPDLMAFVFPPSVVVVLGSWAQLGIILYLFQVGTEVDLRILRSHGRRVLGISAASIALPFVLGILLAGRLGAQGGAPGLPETSVALFLGVSLSVTAFPVLARILTDQGVSRSALGQLALACAAVGDVAAWCLLALAVSTAQANPGRALATVVLTGAFIGLALLLIRPQFERLAASYERRGELTEGMFALIVITVLLAALTTELIGIHALFGAFLLGTLIPQPGPLGGALRQRLQDVVGVLFLPLFFAYTGLRTQVGLLETPLDWLWCAVIILVATVGKWGGGTVAARWSGLRWREASALGILLNTRGLVELIVLNVGLDLGIISPKLYAMLVLMAVITTLMTTPIFRFLTRGQPWRDQPLSSEG